MKTGVLRVRMQGGGLVLMALAATLVVDIALQAREGQLPDTNPKKADAEEPRPSATPVVRETDARKKPRLLASMAYPSGDAQRMLALWRVDVYPPGTAAHARRGGSPGHFFPPNIALLLVESAWETPTKNKVVWVSYRFLHRDVSLRADVVWHAGRKEAFVSLWEARTLHIDIEVHRVNPTKSLTDLPFEKFAFKEDEWDKPANRVFFAGMGKSLPFEDQTQPHLKGRGVLLERDHMLFHGQREAAHALPIYFRLNLENQEWSEVILFESKMAPRKR